MLKTHEILQMIDENELEIQAFRQPEYTQPETRWTVTIVHRGEGESIKVERKALSFSGALMSAWITFERIVQMGKPSIVTPLIEGPPVGVAIGHSWESTDPGTDEVR